MIKASDKTKPYKTQEVLKWQNVQIRTVSARIADAVKTANAAKNPVDVTKNKQTCGGCVPPQILTNGTNDMKHCDCNEPHPSHEKQIPRLNRAIGQLEGIKRMIVERKYCPDILIQFKAVKSAIHAAECEILSQHLNSCVAKSFSSPRDRDREIAEIKKIISGMM